MPNNGLKAWYIGPDMIQGHFEPRFPGAPSSVSSGAEGDDSVQDFDCEQRLPRGRCGRHRHDRLPLLQRSCGHGLASL